MLSEAWRVPVLEGRVAELEEVLADYFQNDREGWTRGWKAWARKAKAVLGIESPHGQARR